MTIARLLLLFLCSVPLGAAEKEVCAWTPPGAAADVERRLFLDPDQLPATMRPLGDALASRACGHHGVASFAVELAKANVKRLDAAGAPWTRNDLAMLLAYQLVDPVRFASDPSFRSAVFPLIAPEMNGATSRALRERQMSELNATIGFDYEHAEEVERAWELVRRASGARRMDGSASSARIADDYAGPIEATVFVLPSSFFSPDDVEPLLASMPERRLVVITDAEMKSALAEKFTNVEWIDSYGRQYAPWPRDPFTVARRGDGGVVLLTRPNVQPGREEDGNIARQITAGASDALDKALGGIKWAVAPAPFHNGQVLLTKDVAWVSMHVLETGNLARLHRSAIPREQFDTLRGIDEYLRASRDTLRDLEKLYGRKVRLVHPLPETGTLAERKKLVEAIYGGGGFDLDSLVTLVPRGNTITAFVADLTLDDALLDATPADEWTRVRNAYGLTAEGLPKRMRDAQHNERARKLDAFVDTIAASLAGEGMRVERVPLLLVPVALLDDRTGLEHEDFVIGWNNVVFERAGGALRANAFATFFDSADRSIAARFAAAGAALKFVPPLVRSVVLNGGYRCATNNVRAAM